MTCDGTESGVAIEEKITQLTNASRKGGGTLAGCLTDSKISYLIDYFNVSKFDTVLDRISLIY